MNKALAVFLAFSICASVLLWKRREGDLRLLRVLYKGPVSIEGRVLNDALPFSRYVDLSFEGYRVRLFFKRPIPPLFAGDNLRVYGVAFVPVEYKNPGAFSSVNFLNRKGIAFFVKVRSWKIIKRGGGLLYLLHRLRVRLISFAGRLNEPLRHIIPALLFGEKHSVPERGVFYRLGVGHLLAVSGIHVAVFVGALYFIFLWLLRFVNLRWQLPYILLPRRSAHLFCLAFSLVLLVFVNWQISACRAVFMYLCYVIFGVLMERDVSLWRSALFALCVFLLLVPWQLFSPGFQYTFLAVFGLSLIQERFGDRPKWVSFSAASFLLPLLLFPVSAFHFHRVYPAAFVFNLLLLPVFSLFLSVLFVLFLFCWMTGLIWPLSALNALFKPLFSFMKTASYASWVVETSKVDWALSLVVAAFALVIVGGRRFFPLLVVAVFVLALAVRDASRDRVVFFDMGPKGEAALVVYKGKKILINAKGVGRNAADALYQALVWEGAKSIDDFVCLISSSSQKRILRFLKRRLRFTRMESCPPRGICRNFSIAGVQFVCFKRDCRSAICKVLEGPVIYRNREILTWKTGAVKILLEE